MFLVTSKMMSPNLDNSVILHTEIGLEVIFKGNTVLGRNNSIVKANNKLLLSYKIIHLVTFAVCTLNRI